QTVAPFPASAPVIPPYGTPQLPARGFGSCTYPFCIHTRRAPVLHQYFAIDDHHVDVPALPGMNQVSKRADVRDEVWTTEVQHDQIGALAYLETADQMLLPHCPGAAHRGHFEDMMRLPFLCDPAFLQTGRGQGPTHKFDHVRMLRVRSQGDIDAGPLYCRSRRHATRRSVALGDVDGLGTGPRPALPLALRQVDPL